MNAKDGVRHGGFDTGEEYSPYEVVHTHQVYELAVKRGHFGIIGGGTAKRVTWPAVGGWIR